MWKDQVMAWVGGALCSVSMLLPIDDSYAQNASHSDGNAIVVPAGGSVRVVSASLPHPNSDLFEPRMIEDLCRIDIEVELFNVDDLTNPVHSHLATITPGKSNLVEFPFRQQALIVTRIKARRAVPQVFEEVDSDLVNILCRGTVTTIPLDGKGNATEGSTTSTFEAEIPFMAGPIPMN